MPIDHPIAERDTAALKSDELISLISARLKEYATSRYKDYLVIKIKYQYKEKVVNYFLTKGYDVTVYANSEYVRIRAKKNEGVLKNSCYPYAFELQRICEESSRMIIIEDDADIEDIKKHFNLENIERYRLANYIDFNELIDYLIRDKGYIIITEDKKVRVVKD